MIPRYTLHDMIMDAPHPLNCCLGTVGQVHATCSSANVCNVPNIAVNAPQLWSPRSPVLHTALLQLVDSTGTIYDSATVRVGLKRVEIIGIHWKLNGEWLYLYGYGDDSIHPMSIAPQLNFSFYLGRLKIAKDLGFNYVRHHTNVLPDEYFAAACAVGIIVQAEFPMFGGRDGCSGATFACDKNAVYFEEWRATILRLRNHPCVFDCECWPPLCTACGTIPAPPSVDQMECLSTTMYLTLC